MIKMNFLVLIFCLFNLAIVLANGFKISDIEDSQKLMDNNRAKRSPDVVEAGKELFAQSMMIPAQAAQNAFGAMAGAVDKGIRNRRNVQSNRRSEAVNVAGNSQENYISRILSKRETDESYDEPSIISGILDTINELLASFIASASEFIASLRSRMQADKEEDEP